MQVARDLRRVAPALTVFLDTSLGGDACAAPAAGFSPFSMSDSRALICSLTLENDMPSTPETSICPSQHEPCPSNAWEENGGKVIDPGGARIILTCRSSGSGLYAPERQRAQRKSRLKRLQNLGLLSRPNRCTNVFPENMEENAAHPSAVSVNPPGLHLCAPKAKGILSSVILRFSILCLLGMGCESGFGVPLGHLRLLVEQENLAQQDSHQNTEEAWVLTGVLHTFQWHLASAAACP